MAKATIVSRVSAPVNTVKGVLARFTPQVGSRARAVELLTALLDVPRHWALLHADEVLGADTIKRLEAAVALHARGAPVAYAVGTAAFRSLMLKVDERVLIPRPETEVLVDLVLARRPQGAAIADVGTGSGAIAIALAIEGKYETVFATDSSADALEVAQANVARYAPVANGIFVFEHGDLLSPLGRYDDVPLSVVVSNPPYITFDEMRELPASVRDWEPASALVCADNGLEVTRRLVQQAGSRLDGAGLLALEVDTRRAALVAELVAADRRYEDISVHLDLTGRERFVLATRKLDQ